MGINEPDQTSEHVSARHDIEDCHKGKDYKYSRKKNGEQFRYRQRSVIFEYYIGAMLIKIKCGNHRILIVIGYETHNYQLAKRHDTGLYGT